ncbi:hypothetical protein R1flu_010140 [Riccia fluitans]|uniref:Uncharacterized protein n=1 Tax=Riccia fluitans TaxID=41844 RepID=A0ABD1Z454_9MARC
MREGMREVLKSAALGMLNLWHPKTALAAFRGRNASKAIHNAKLTIVCGFVTIVVLRGSVGFGKFGDPSAWASSGNDDPSSEYFAYRHEQQQKRFLAERGIKASSTPHQWNEGETYSLGPKIIDWDEQRAAWFDQNPGKRTPKPSTLLVSGSQPDACENSLGDHYLLKSMKNKIDYCRLHGIKILYNIAHMDTEMSGFWAKLPLIRKLMLSHPDIEWFWWMDSDAMFTDMLFEVPMEKYTDYNLVLHGWDDMVYKRKNWIGLNTGSFLIRNCQWSLDLLDLWAPFGPRGVRKEMGKLLTASLSGRPVFEADDQSALIYLLATRKEELSEKVYLENSFYLHGYWVILVEKFEQMMEKYHPGLGDDRWPFVTHFVGCKPCKKNSGDYSNVRCFKEMERAFNFADNQVLQRYGLQHAALGTSSVVRTRNDTSRPLEV